MNTDLERELKILLNQETFFQILHSYEFEKPFVQRNIYFDTEDQYLKDIGGALRLRLIDGEHILTIKLKNDSTSKYEYERKTEAETFDQLSQDDWNWIHQHLPGLPEDLRKIADFETSRHNLILPHAILSLDETSFPVGKDYELEYEYTENHDGKQVLNEILIPFGLSFEKNCPSKLARAVSKN